MTHYTYKDLYCFLLNSITDALDDLNEGSVILAIEKLKDAQIRAEKFVLETDDIPDQDDEEFVLGVDILPDENSRVLMFTNQET